MSCCWTSRSCLTKARSASALVTTPRRGGGGAGSRRHAHRTAPGRQRASDTVRPWGGTRQKSQQAPALLLITEHAIVIARESNGKVISEMQLAHIRRIESSMPDVRARESASTSASARARTHILTHYFGVMDHPNRACPALQEVQITSHRTTYGIRATGGVDDIISCVRVCHARDFPTPAPVRRAAQEKTFSATSMTH